MKLTKTYNLSLDPANAGKLELAGYTYARHLAHVQYWAITLYKGGLEVKHSTAGMGTLANQAQHRARGIVRALRASAKATGNKTSRPEVERIGCPATIRPAKASESVAYWLAVENQFTARGRVLLPTKAHRKFNEALRNGWKLNEKSAELYRAKNGRLYARIYVQREVAKAQPGRNGTLGADVGIAHSVVTSDGYFGKALRAKIKRAREKDAERRRQDHTRSTRHSCIKQVLDAEAYKLVRRSGNSGQSLNVEDPKVLANLRSGRIHGWARSYFANRCLTLGQELQVYVRVVHPAYTSQTCSECGHKDRRNRVNRAAFVCTACKSAFHADFNAARNIARMGSESSGGWSVAKSGFVNGGRLAA